MGLSKLRRVSKNQLRVGITLASDMNACSPQTPNNYEQLRAAVVAANKIGRAAVAAIVAALVEPYPDLASEKLDIVPEQEGSPIVQDLKRHTPGRPGYKLRER